MKTVIIMLAALAVWSGAAWSGAAAADLSGEELYQLYCAQCHGTRADGMGVNWTSGGLAVFPMDHTSAKNMSRLNVAAVKLAITKGGDAVGKSELMPGWGEVLTEAQIDLLVGHLGQLCKCPLRAK